MSNQSNQDGLVLPPLANSNTTTTSTNNNNNGEDAIVSSSIPPNLNLNLNRSDTVGTLTSSQLGDSDNDEDTDVSSPIQNTDQPTTTTTTTTTTTNNDDPQFTDEEDEINNDLITANKSNIDPSIIPDEIVHDGKYTWLPIHLIRKTKAKFWTHYLALDKTLMIVRCKHCSEILEKFSNLNNNNNITTNTDSTNESLENTKKFQRHLKQKHNLNPLISYYKNNEDIIYKSTNSSSRFLQPSKSVQSLLLSQHSINGFNFNDLNAQQRQILYPFSQLMAIIIASQNLSIGFIMDPAMKLLYSKLSQPYLPDPSNVKLTIRQISTQINNIIKRTAQRNDLDLQLIIDMDNLPMDLNDRTSILSERLKFFLNEINNITLFSITSSVWLNKIDENNNKNLTNVLALNFLDHTKDIIKTIPLNIIISDSTNLNTITMRNQLLNVMQNVKGLNKSVLSMTMSHSRLINMEHIDQSDFFTTNQSPYHNCIVDILANIVKPIFGTINTDNDNDPLLNPTTTIKPTNLISFKPKDFYSNDPEQHLLDACVNLNNVNILNNSQSIFHRIKIFYNEIQSNPWQLERFISLYKEKFNESHGPILQCFDSMFYSTAQTTLETFLKLKSIIQETQKSLHGEKFSDSDFKLISIINEFITSINKIILYFTSTKKMNFIYIIFTMLSLEKQLNEMINDCKFDSLSQTLKEIKYSVQHFKDILLKDDTNLLALFCCPATLFDRTLLQYVFHTVSLSDIVNIISNTVRQIIKRFINIEFVTNQQNVNDPNHQFFNGNENKIIEDEIDIILTQIINEDLYAYLSTVNTIVPLSYKAYCEQSDYIRYDGRFKRRRIRSDDDDLEHESDDEIENVHLNYTDEFLDIHVPVCNAFWDQYLANEAGLIIKLLSKIMITESASSRRAEYEFLNNFIPKLGEDYLEDVVKIKLFNEQYSAGKVDYDVDTLATAAQYD